MEGPIAYILMLCNAALVAMVAFFLKQLLNRFDRVEKSLNKLNVELATIVANLDHHKDKFNRIDNGIDRLDVENKGVRERLHSLGNDVNGMHLKCELAHEHFNREQS